MPCWTLSGTSVRQEPAPDSIIMDPPAQLKGAAADFQEIVTRIETLGTMIVVENGQVQFRRADPPCCIYRPFHHAIGNPATSPIIAMTTIVAPSVNARPVRLRHKKVRFSSSS